MGQDSPNDQNSPTAGEKLVNLGDVGEKPPKSVRFDVGSPDETECASTETFSPAKESNEREDYNDSANCAQTPRGRALQQTKKRGKRSQTPFARRHVSTDESDDDEDDNEGVVSSGGKSTQLTEPEPANEGECEKSSEDNNKNSSNNKDTSASEGTSKRRDCASQEAEMSTESLRGRERFVSNKVSKRSQTPFNHRMMNMDEIEDDDDSESNAGSEWSEKTIETGADSNDGSGKSDSGGEDAKPSSSSEEKKMFAREKNDVTSVVPEPRIFADQQNEACFSVSSKADISYTKERKSCAVNPSKSRVSFCNERKDYTTSPSESSIYFSEETEDLNKHSSKPRISFADNAKSLPRNSLRPSVSVANSQKSSNGGIYKPRNLFADDKKSRNSLKQRVSFFEQNGCDDTGSAATGGRKTKFTVTSCDSTSGNVQFAKAATSTSESFGSDSDLKSSLNTSDEDTDDGGEQKSESRGTDTLREGHRAVSFAVVTGSDSSHLKGSSNGSHSQEFERQGPKASLSRRNSRGIRWAVQEDEGPGKKGYNVMTNGNGIRSGGSKCVRFADSKSEGLGKTDYARQNSGTNSGEDNERNGGRVRGRKMRKTKNKRSQTPFSRYNVNIYGSEDENSVNVIQRSQSVGRGVHDWNMGGKDPRDKRQVVSFDTGALMAVKREGMYNKNEMRVQGLTMPVRQMRGRTHEVGMSGKHRSPTPFAKRRIDIYADDSEDEDSTDDVARKGVRSVTTVKRVEAWRRRENSLKEDGKEAMSRAGSLQTVNTLRSYEENDGCCRVEKGRKEKDIYDVCRTISRVTMIPSMDAEVERFEKGTQTETAADGAKWNIMKPFAGANVGTNEARVGWMGVFLGGIIRGVLGNCG